ncbi:MAG: serine/threonine protein kinase [Planctomycetes bacterium]|nr:serine/threonine protein kinase [Planctomycetota bacterium]
MTGGHPGGTSSSGRTPRPGTATADLHAEVEAARKKPGRSVGKLVILNEIGRGGMGVVYRAWQDDLQRVVAVKMLSPEANDNMRKRFLREARLASRLRHPHIVAVHELGEHGTRAWFTMDLIEGTGLDVLIKKRRVTTPQFMQIAGAVAGALDYAHGVGVFHRDIKPSNVIVAPDGTAFLMDFGLAIEQAGASKLTMSGMVMGTPFYMSPEQARGESAAIDARSDVFSLGAVIYEGLTGHTPFARADMMSTMKAVVEDEPEAPSRKSAGVPRDLEVVCLKCLEKDPSRRYATAGALAADIERWVAGQSIEAKAAGLGSRAVKAIRRRLLWVGAGVAALAVLGLVGYFVDQQRRMKAELAALRDELARETDPEKRRALEAAIAARMEGRAPPEEKPVENPPAKPPEKPPEQPPVKAPDETSRGVLADEAGWEVLAGRIAPLRRAGTLGAALREVEAWKAETPQYRKRAADLAASIRFDAQAAFDRARTEAARLESEGKIADALRCFDAVLAMDLPDLAMLAAAEKRRLAQVQLDRDRAAALHLLDPLLAEILEYGTSLDFAAARQAVARVRQEAPSLSGDLEIWEGLISEAEAALACAAAGAEKSRGEELDLPIGKVKIEGATEQRIRLALAGGGEAQLRYAELPADDLLRFVRGGGAKPVGLGLLSLFCGREAAARRAWAESPRRAELDALADRISALAAETEARRALASLLEAARRKDWRKCREGLAQRAKFAESPAWRAAAAELSELEFQAAETVEGEPFAVPVRRWGLGFFMTWDFSAPAQLRDWRAELHAGGGSAGRQGLRLEDGAIWLRDGTLELNAPLRGDVEIRADFTLLEGEPAGFGIAAGGYRFVHRPGAARIEFSCFSQSPAKPRPLPEPGRMMHAVLRIAGGKVAVILDGEEVLSVPAEDPVFTSPPSFFTDRGTTVRIDNVVVNGQPPKAWADEWRARQALLARVGRGLALDKPQPLTDGATAGRFQTPDRALWITSDGALRGTASGDRPVAELFINERWRNFRLRLRFRFESGRNSGVDIRTAGNPIQIALPGDLPGKWRDLEVVALESAVTAMVDGQLPLLPYGWPDDPAAGGLRITVQDASVSFRDVVLEEIKSAPAEEEWRELLAGAEAAGFRLKGLAIEDRVLTGVAPVSLESVAPCGDGTWRIYAGAWEPTPLRITLRGETVFDHVIPGSNRVLMLRIRGDVLEARLDRTTIVEERKLKRGPGPMLLEWGKGRIALRSLKVRSAR